MAAARRRSGYVMISAVAERYDIHPQTLRLYEREGLLDPPRSKGNTRLYDERSLRRLESILTLTRDMGVNLAGVEVVLRLQDELDRLKSERDQAVKALRRAFGSRGATVHRTQALVRVTRGPLVPLEDEARQERTGVRGKESEGGRDTRTAGTKEEVAREPRTARTEGEESEPDE